MSKRILIVDDEANARLSFRMTLELEGYEVFEARSAEEALELLAERPFALAILDMRMSGMDGLELLGRLHVSGIGITAIVVTAYGDVPLAVKAMKLGAVDFLRRPIRLADFRQLVAEIFNRHAGQTDPSDNSFRAHIVAAKRCLNLQVFANARLHLSKALELDPKSVEALNLAGVLAELLEDYGKAKKYYGQAIRLDSRYEPAQQNMRRLFEVDHFGSSKEPVNLGDNG
jgi:FixJ family two-component response regulator